MARPFIRSVASVVDTTFDGLVLVSCFSRNVEEFASLGPLGDEVKDFLKAHQNATSTANLLRVPTNVAPTGRLIVSGTGPVTRDFDDVRRFQTAAKNGIKLARSVGMRRPIFVTTPNPRFPQAELVSALGALGPFYSPLNVREEEPENTDSFIGLFPVLDKDLVDKVHYFEQAFTVCRDIGEQGPERMAPPRVADYIRESFGNSSNIKLEIEDDQDVILREYPLMHAVNRCANTVPEHQARLIRLEYTGEGPIEKTFFLVGKGVTLDTGGCDLKISGHMFGMCRDKYGSAVVAGFFKALEHFKPKNIKVVGYMCMVRNSIGARAYTCDEVIKSRSGKRIHIYNTDAEGRITMLDPLTKAKDEAKHEKNPHLMTLATLTGHEILSYGYYATMMDNGPAKKDGLSRALQAFGDEYGQPIEISRLHPEDYTFHLAECPQADIRQGNTKPSVQTLRGHQTPAAFLIMASGIDQHGTDSEHPLKFTHVDMGGCEGDHPDTSFPNPLVTLVAGLILH